MGMGSYIYAGEFPWFFDQGDIEGPLLRLLYTWDDAFGVWVAVPLKSTRRDAFGVRSELRFEAVYSRSSIFLDFNPALKFFQSAFIINIDFTAI